ncbi:MAG: bifunctional oligoribonuclease/PAP phosphatase NrnA [Treponema sp.]|jgi:phosphoesterase RecJ-like protein|nr:bifunctional oligoribonuclease/PAP phosphatase NrnA [Treponema sp.]
MFESILSFIDRHNSFILTTHDYLDADGLGSELVLRSILKKREKPARIINVSVIPENLEFLLKDTVHEKYDKDIHLSLFENSAVIILDTSNENHLGIIKEDVKKAEEVFFFDHHEQNPCSTLKGFSDTTASSTSELAIELACFLEVEIDPVTATAAYAGIVYDSGFFAYPKTSIRTFNAAIRTLEWGASPNYIYRQLMENSSYASMLLQRQALLNMEFIVGKKIAVIVLRKNDYEITGADYEESENIVNIPLRTKETEVSILIKENPKGDIRCSLRSKGMVDVSKIARDLGGGGHVTAAGFRSSSGIDSTLKKLLADIKAQLDLCGEQ